MIQYPRPSLRNERWTNQFWHGRWPHHTFSVQLIVDTGGFVSKVLASAVNTTPGAPVLIGRSEHEVGPFDELREIVAAAMITAAIDAGEQLQLPGV